ncbi:MAG: PhzF family phenazine biosynthesis protein [Myxococcota bacterium]
MPLEAPFAELHAFPDGDRPHSGNPAALMLLEAYLPDADLLGLARSSNLSETAFLVPRGDDAWQLRWFTPGHEVDLCGHATMASAVWLFETGRVAGEAVHFATRSGELVVRREGGAYAMDFPAVGCEPTQTRPDIAEALGVTPRESHRIARVHGSPYELHVLGSEAEVAGLAPDFSALARTGTNVVVSAAPAESAEIVSRFFCPAAGIDEDPVTGSAHCTLGPFWAERLGKARLAARQIGPRPGSLEVETKGERVLLRGTARRFVDGLVHLPA